MTPSMMSGHAWNIVNMSSKWRICAAAIIKLAPSVSSVSRGTRAYHVFSRSLLLRYVFCFVLFFFWGSSGEFERSLDMSPAWYVTPSKQTFYASFALTCDWSAVNLSRAADRIERNSVYQRVSGIVGLKMLTESSLDRNISVSLSLRCKLCVLLRSDRGS